MPAVFRFTVLSGMVGSDTAAVTRLRRCHGPSRGKLCLLDVSGRRQSPRRLIDVRGVSFPRSTRSRETILKPRDSSDMIALRFNSKDFRKIIPPRLIVSRLRFARCFVLDDEIIHVLAMGPKHAIHQRVHASTGTAHTINSR